MTDCKNPSTSEMLERIVRLEKQVERLGTNLYNLSSDFLDQHKALEHQFAAERIKNLEEAVFPNLKRDRENIHKIIGGDGPNEEPTR